MYLYLIGQFLWDTLLRSIVDKIPNRSVPSVAINYRHHFYDLISQRLDQVSSRIRIFLQSEGSQALPIPASKRTDNERLCSIFSHKMAAQLAGLGWIGKNCPLITPEDGLQS